MRLYQFAVLWHPTAEEKKEGKKDKVIVPINTVVAADDKSATLMAGREIPKEYLECLDQVEVAVRPF
jgi:hypothetical protein